MAGQGDEEIRERDNAKGAGNSAQGNGGTGTRRQRQKGAFMKLMKAGTQKRGINGGTGAAMQQDIVWVKFPYSDFSEGKFRPAVVVSNNTYNKERPDIAVCGVTSRLDKKEYSIVIDDSNISSGKLAMKSRVRADKIQLIEKALVAKAFARLDDRTFDLLGVEIMKLVKRGKQ